MLSILASLPILFERSARLTLNIALFELFLRIQIFFMGTPIEEKRKLGQNQLT